MTKRKWYKKKRFLLPIFAIVAAFGFVGFVVFSIWADMNRPTYYERGSDFPFDKLPPSARHVRTTRPVPFAPNSIYDFECTESDFRLWVEATRRKHPELGIIEESPRGVYPFFDKDGEIDQRVISNCLVSQWTFEDQGLHLVYDQTTGRALRWYHSR